MGDQLNQFLPPGVDWVTALLVVNLGIVFLMALAIAVSARFKTRRVIAELPDGQGAAELDLAMNADGSVDRFDRSFASMLRRSEWPVSVTEAMAIILMVALVCAGIGVALNAPDWVALAALLVGSLIPLVVFYLLHRQWRKAIEDELPNFIYLLHQSVLSGLTLSDAIADYASHVDGPLSKELDLAMQEVNLGIPLPEALGSTARRIDLAVFDRFVAVVSMHSITGGDLPYLLEQVAKGIRSDQQFKGYVRSATAIGRISAITMVLAFPLIFLVYYVTEPLYLQSFFGTFEGWIAFAVGVILEVTGALWLWYLLRGED